MLAVRLPRPGKPVTLSRAKGEGQCDHRDVMADQCPPETRVENCKPFKVNGAKSLVYSMYLYVTEALLVRVLVRSTP